MLTTLAALLICVFVMGCFYGLIGLSLWCSSRDFLVAIWRNKKNWLALLVIILLGFIFCAYILRQNHFVYYWDYAGYWSYSYQYMQHLFVDPLSAIKELITSIWYNEYNNILPAVIALPLRLIGITFIRYVLINYLFFLVPTWLVLSSIAWKWSHRLKTTVTSNTLIIILVLIFLMTFRVFYLAMLRGYIDVACLLPLGAAALLAMNYDATIRDRHQFQRDILISLLLLTTFLCRRYFAYGVIGFGFGLIALSFWQACAASDRRSAFLAALINLLIIGGTAATVLLFFLWPLVARVISNNYAGQYVGYDAPWSRKLATVTHIYGWWSLALAIIGGIWMLTNKKQQTYGIFWLVWLVIAPVSFFTVQNMGIHHAYILLLPVCMLGTYVVVMLMGHSPWRRLAIVALLICQFLAFGHTFLPDLRAQIRPTASWWGETYDPLVRHDIAVLEEMVDYLNTTSATMSGKVYIAASGSILNASIIDALYKPMQTAPLHNQGWTADVDLRDGFPVDFLQSDLIVITQPVQTHLQPGSQEVVTYLVDQVADHQSYLGRHFEQLPVSFALDNDVTAYVYHKMSAFTPTDLAKLSAYYMNLYPAASELFAARILGGQDATDATNLSDN